MLATKPLFNVVVWHNDHVLAWLGDQEYFLKTVLMECVGICITCTASIAAASNSIVLP
jgi:hypothetical protein